MGSPTQDVEATLQRIKKVFGTYNDTHAFVQPLLGDVLVAHCIRELSQRLDETNTLLAKLVEQGDRR